MCVSLRETRREYVHVASSSTSMSPTVSRRDTHILTPPQARRPASGSRSIDPPAWLSVVERLCPRRDRRRHGCRRRGPMDGFTPCPGLGKAFPRRPSRKRKGLKIRRLAGAAVGERDRDAVRAEYGGELALSSAERRVGKEGVGTGRTG